jgi:acyl carrier protein
MAIGEWAKNATFDSILMPDTHALETKIKRLLVDALELSDVDPESIVSDAPLFGEGLGLDSIDALELAAALEKTFAFKFSDAQVDMKATFFSVRALAAHVARFGKDGVGQDGVGKDGLGNDQVLGERSPA